MRIWGQLSLSTHHLVPVKTETVYTLILNRYSYTCQQEARRIVVAQWQHVIYNEWLPIILGRQIMERFGLYPLTSGYSNDYRWLKHLIITRKGEGSVSLGRDISSKSSNKMNVYVLYFRFEWKWLILRSSLNAAFLMFSAPYLFLWKLFWKKAYIRERKQTN